MRYYIADLHFCHSNLNQRMDCRGFESGEAMNEYMIKQWNSRVRRGDEVVILGDFCLSRDIAEVNTLLSRLKGKKYLIVGNHDRYLENREFDCEAFKWIEYYKEMNDDKRKIILSHYPIMCYNGQYLRNGDGEPNVYMLYGHVHNTFDEYLVNEHMKQLGQYKRPVRGSSEMVEIPCQMINCFCMFSDYVPLTLDEWIELDKKRRARISIDNVIFSHGGLTEEYVKKYFKKYINEDVDEVIQFINNTAQEKLWNDESPLWYRPQYKKRRAFGREKYIQVVGHTPVEKIYEKDGFISTDVFSTYRDGTQIGESAMIIIDTETGKYEKIIVER